MVLAGIFFCVKTASSCNPTNAILQKTIILTTCFFAEYALNNNAMNTLRIIILAVAVSGLSACSFDASFSTPDFKTDKTAH